MIEAYRIGVNLVMDQTKVLGPLGAVLKSFEAIQAAQRATQAGLNELASGTRAAAAATNRLAEAWRNVAAAAQNAGRAARGAGGTGSPASGGGQGNGAMPPPNAPANNNSMLRLSASSGGALAPFYGYPVGRGGSGGNQILFGGYGGGGGGGGMVAAGGGGGGGGGPQLLLGGAGPLTLNYPGAVGPPGNMPQGMGNFSMVGAYNAFHVVERLVSGIARLTEKAAGFNDALVSLEQRGVGAGAVNGIEGVAFAIAAKVPGRTLEQITKDAGSLRAVLGESPGSDSLESVKAFLPDVENTAAAISGGGHISSEAALHMLFRAIEMRGGTIGKDGKISPERFKTELNAVYKVLQTAGGIVSERDILNLVQQGSLVAKTMPDPDEFWKMMLAPLVDQKGSRAGTSLQAAGRQLFGGKMTGDTAIELGRILGFDNDAFEAEQPGKAGKAALVKLRQELLEKTITDMKGGLADFIEKDIRPGLVKHGFDTEEKQSQELFKIAGTDTFRRLLSLFLSNADQVLKEGQLYNKVPSVEEANKLLNKESINYNMKAMFASIMNFFEAAEKVNAPAIIATMQAIKGFVDFFTSGIAAQEQMKNLSKAGAEKYGAFWHYNPMEKGFWLGGGIGSGAGPRPDNDNSVAPRGTVSQALQLKGDVNLDGKKVGTIVADGMADRMSRPSTGTNGPDLRMSPWMPGLAAGAR